MHRQDESYQNDPECNTSSSSVNVKENRFRTNPAALSTVIVRKSLFFPVLHEENSSQMHQPAVGQMCGNSLDSSVRKCKRREDNRPNLSVEVSDRIKEHRPTLTLTMKQHPREVFIHLFD